MKLAFFLDDGRISQVYTNFFFRSLLFPPVNNIIISNIVRVISICFDELDISKNIYSYLFLYNCIGSLRVQGWQD